MIGCLDQRGRANEGRQADGEVDRALHVTEIAVEYITCFGENT
jgi:hypothetical protein